jgi:hypothetical protein
MNETTNETMNETMNPVPIRVRRSRSRGWRKPPWTVNVARPITS